MSDATEAIAQLCEGIDPGSFVNRFVVVAEIIDADGERAIITDTSDDATRWDTYGLLRYALEEEVASHHVAAMHEDLDDEDPDPD